MPPHSAPGRLRWLQPALAVLLLPIVPHAGPAADLFEPFLQGTPPGILKDLPAPSMEGTPDGVRVRRLVFESIVVEEMTNEVFAAIASPTQPGPHPGLLLLHGGQGRAPEAEAIVWAQRGYVALALDLPGIADPIHTTNSAGAWRYRPYNAMVWTVTPTPEASVLFDATAAALQGFNLLGSQPGVDRKRLGILGWSWGGYLTTQLSGLLAGRVAAAFSHYGSGFYEDTWFGIFLSWMQPADRALWLETFDAGRRAPAIRAPYFLAAAANDTYFRPPAIEHTLSAIPGTAGVVYAPNADHQLPVPGGTNMRPGDFLAETWFDWHLRGSGNPFPSIDWKASPRPGTIAFQVNGPSPVLAASLWYSRTDPSGSWPDRRWTEVPANPRGSGLYEVSLPAEAQTLGAAWFVLASDDRPISVSSRLQIMGVDREARFLLHDGFADAAANSRPAGWLGTGVVREEPDVSPKNQALAPGTASSFSLANPQAAPSGIELSFRIRPDPRLPDWRMRWEVVAASGAGPAVAGAGYALVLTRDTATIHRLGEALPLASVSFTGNPMQGGTWTGIGFRWKPGGDLELSLQDEPILQTQDPAAPPIHFHLLAGSANSDALLVDDITVGRIPTRTALRAPALVDRGASSYAAESNTTTTVFRFSAEPGIRYLIEHTQELGTKRWSALGEYQANPEGRFSVPLTLEGNLSIDPDAAVFFRITRTNP